MQGKGISPDTGAITPRQGTTHAHTHSLLEHLEPRTLLSVATGSAARLVTTLGPVDIELFDSLTPLTVANFLNYINTNAYDNTLIHRSVGGFVVQGGGYETTPPFHHIATNPPVVNEFSPATTNTRGRISMAKSAGNPNSATSEWFINLDNNSANLDSQNGGFTAFGEVLGGGMRIIDQIAALPTYGFADPFGEIPLRNYASFPTTPAAANFITVENASPLQVMTVILGDTTERAVTFQDANGTTATVSLAGTGMLTLKFVGSGLASSTDGNTYTVTGSDVALKEARAEALARNSAITTQATGGTGVIDIGVLSVITGGDVRAISFTDVNNTNAKVAIKGGGRLTALLAGQNLNMTIRNGTAVVTGQNVAVNELDTTATTAQSTLSIVTRGSSAKVAIGGIFCDAPLAAIDAPAGSILSGEMSVQGTLRRLKLWSMDHALIALRGVDGLTSITIGTATDSSLSCLSPLSQLRVGQWLNTDGVDDLVGAPTISQLQSVTNFEPDLSLTGTGQVLGFANIRGTLRGTWTMSGNAGRISAGATDSNFSATFTGGNIAKLKVGDMAGSFSGGSIASLVAGSLHDASIVLTQAVGAVPALGKLVSGSAIVSTLIDATGNIGSVTARGLISSKVYAGIGTLGSGQTLPDDSADFASTAAIGSLNLHAPPGVASFVNSSVAASQIGTASLGLITTDNTGTPFGLATHRFGVLSGIANAKAFRLVNVTTAQQLAVLVAARQVNFGDMSALIL